MTVGTGIFLASIVLAVTALFMITRDRWNWAKGLKRISIGSALLIGVLVAAYFAWDRVQQFADRPKPLQEFVGIKLGASQSDVKFLKGLPDVTCTDSVTPGWSLWGYKLATDSTSSAHTYLMVRFMEPIGAWAISAFAFGQSLTGAPSLDHVDEYSSLESINQRFGPPSNIRPSEDQLSRDYLYRRFNLHVTFAQGRVTEYGINHPKKPDYVKLPPGSKNICVDREGKPVS